MAGVLAWLEGSALGEFMRESSLWTYPLVNLAHLLGVASLFGVLLVLDLRLVGFWRSVPLSGLSGPTSRMAQMGFAVAAVSGIGLLATQATEYAGNYYFLIKLAAIAAGLLNVGLLYRTRAWRAHAYRSLTRHEERQLARMGGTSLLCWLIAITAGRMIAYW